MRLRFWACVFAALSLVIPSVAIGAPTPASVGRQLFFDVSLSSPPGQSCASCHDSAAGFADPGGSAVSSGAVDGRVGSRNAPSAAYAAYIPPRHYDASIGAFVGGQFWDGRADTLEEQAKGPFLNPLEMNMPTAASVVAAVSQSTYADDFRAVFGVDSLSMADADSAYDLIAFAIAEYERSAELNRFSSKHDYAMSLPMGPSRMQAFSTLERQGMMLFQGKGKCVLCHVGAGMSGGGMGGGGMGSGATTGTGGMGGGGMGSGATTGTGGMGGGGMGSGATTGTGGMGGGGMGSGATTGTGGMGGMAVTPTEPPMTDMPLFTDHRYVNLGIPKNPENPFYHLPGELNPDGASYIDHGLAAAMPGGVAGNPTLDGMYRTPTLRNIAKTAPYGHNGYFKTLKSIINFYNMRDTTTWPEPEVPSTIDTATMGNLGLTNAEENAIVAFLGTLTDGWWANAPDPQPPVTVLDVSGTRGNAGWFVSPVTVTLEALDFGRGVDAILYSTSAAVWELYWTPVVIENSGVFDFGYRARDLAGNLEAVDTEQVRIDMTPPVVSSANAGATYFEGQSVTVDFSASDAHSGVASVTADVGRGEVLPTSQTGTFNYTVHAIDIAGNDVDCVVSYTVIPRTQTLISLTTTSHTLPAPGAACVVSGSLVVGDDPVALAAVALECSTDGVNFVPAATGITDSTGGFTFTHVPDVRCWYRVSYSGDVSRLGCSSSSVVMLPRASITRPILPSGFSVGARRTVYGYLEPQHDSGEYTVRLYRWRYVAGAWRSYGYANATISDRGAISRYSRALSFPTTGRWRVHALAPADAGHASTWSSGYSYTTVR